MRASRISSAARVSIFIHATRMILPHRTPSSCRHLAGVALFCSSLVLAQTAPRADLDAATLARYDKNQNGRLDPEEMAALDADRAKITPTERSERDPSRAADEV